LSQGKPLNLQPSDGDGNKNVTYEFYFDTFSKKMANIAIFFSLSCFDSNIVDTQWLKDVENQDF
jgi:hypothetical protein